MLFCGDVSFGFVDVVGGLVGWLGYLLFGGLCLKYLILCFVKGDEIDKGEVWYVV